MGDHRRLERAGRGVAMRTACYYADTEYAECVIVCDECGSTVSVFKRNDEGRAACVPCGHRARVSLVLGRPLPIKGPS